MKERAGIQTFMYKNNYEFMYNTIKLDQIFDHTPAILQTYENTTSLLQQTASKDNKNPIIIARIANIVKRPDIEVSQFLLNDGYTPNKVINGYRYTFVIYPVIVTLNCEYVSNNHSDIIKLATDLICQTKIMYKLKNELLPLGIRFEIVKNFDIPTINFNNGDSYNLKFDIKLSTWVGNIMQEPEISKATVDYTVANQAGQTQRLP